MKKPPDNPEFARFTSAMQTILKVSKEDLDKAERKRKQSKASAFPVAGASSKREG